MSPDVRELLDLSRRRSSIVGGLTEQAAAVVTEVCAGQPIVATLRRPFSKEGAFGFRTMLPAEFQRCLRDGRTLTLKEDDRVLGPADALHDDIRKQGKGAYSFWNGAIYLSSSDGSDCNANGRTYRVVAEP